MTTGFHEFDNRIHDLAERENECDGLFEEIKNGNGEKSLRYLALRDSCRVEKRNFQERSVSGTSPEKDQDRDQRSKRPDGTNAKQT